MVDADHVEDGHRKKYSELAERIGYLLERVFKPVMLDTTHLVLITTMHSHESEWSVAIICNNRFPHRLPHDNDVNFDESMTCVTTTLQQSTSPLRTLIVKHYSQLHTQYNKIVLHTHIMSDSNSQQQQQQPGLIGGHVTYVKGAAEVSRPPPPISLSLLSSNSLPLPLLFQKSPITPPMEKTH